MPVHLQSSEFNMAHQVSHCTNIFLQKLRASEDGIQTLPVHSESLPSKTEEKRWVCLRQGEPTGGPQNLDAAPKAVFLGQEDLAGSEANHVVLLFVLGAGCTGSCVCLIFLGSANLPQSV